MSRRRLIARTVVCVALGVATTVAVAWSIAAFTPHRGWAGRVLSVNSTSETRCFIDLEEFRALGAVRRTWQWNDHGEFFSSPLQQIERSWPMAYDAMPVEGPLEWPPWGRFEQVRADPQKWPTYGCEHACGWPVVALWYAVERNARRGQAPVVRWGIPIGERGGGPFPSVRALPWRPAWAGLAMDSAAYAVVWAALLFAISSLRAWRRTGDGQCPACAYPIGASPVCTECGKPVPARGKGATA